MRALYRQALPLNKGVIDGNRFRFFVERNVGLLAGGGKPELRASQPPAELILML